MDEPTLNDDEKWLLCHVCDHVSPGGMKAFLSPGNWSEPSDEPYVQAIVERMKYDQFRKCMLTLDAYGKLDVMEGPDQVIEHLPTGEGIEYCRRLDAPGIDIEAESLEATKASAAAAERSAQAAEDMARETRRATSAARFAATAAWVAAIVAIGSLIVSIMTVLR